MADRRIARLGKGEAPGPGTMCFHYLKPMHRCALVPNHKGDHRYARFTVTKTKEK